MKSMNYGALTLLGLLIAQQADAQAITLRGVRADAQVGIDRFYSESVNDSHLAWGAAVGVDTFAGDKFVLGVEGTFLKSRAENVVIDGTNVTTHRSLGEWGGAVRAGVMVTPSTLVYAKGGVVVNRQRKQFSAVNALQNYDTLYHTRGYLIGAGIEQLVGTSIYLKAEGRYANYRNSTSRLTGLLGLGVLFGPSAEPVVVAPPPPPPPPAPVAPATQTCPDGSVILATDACPAPVVETPPPPPPPAPERG